MKHNAWGGRARAAMVLGAAAAAAGCDEGTRNADGPAERTAQAIVACTRDLRLDPLAGGPVVIPGVGIYTFGRERVSASGTWLREYTRRQGLVETHWEPSAGRWSYLRMVGSGLATGPTGVLWNGQMGLLATNANNELVEWTFVYAGDTVPEGRPVPGSVPIDSAPSAALFGNQLRVFARSASTAVLVERRSNGTWTDWSPVGEQQISSAPAAVALDDRLMVFARGTDNTLQFRSELGGAWGPWQRVGSSSMEVTSSPAALWLGWRVVVFAVGPSGDLVESFSDDRGATWSGWYTHPGRLTSGPAALLHGNSVFVFARDANGELAQRYYDGRWNPWQSLDVGNLATNTCPSGSIVVEEQSVVRSACSAAVASTSICSPTRACSTVARWPCFPYGCNSAGTGCATRCVTNADCTTGTHCDTVLGRCVYRASTCRDAVTEVHASGVEVNCAPYACVGGRCREQCVSSAECASGYECLYSRCQVVRR